MTLGQWNLALDRLAEILGDEAPDEGEEAVERNLRRMKRQAQRRKIWKAETAGRELEPPEE